MELNWHCVQFYRTSHVRIIRRRSSSYLLSNLVPGTLTEAIQGTRGREGGMQVDGDGGFGDPTLIGNAKNKPPSATASSSYLVWVLSPSFTWRRILMFARRMAD